MSDDSIEIDLGDDSDIPPQLPPERTVTVRIRGPRDRVLSTATRLGGDVELVSDVGPEFTFRAMPAAAAALEQWLST
jgi:hypothetical protein